MIDNALKTITTCDSLFLIKNCSRRQRFLSNTFGLKTLYQNKLTYHSSVTTLVLAVVTIVEGTATEQDYGSIHNFTWVT